MAITLNSLPQFDQTNATTTADAINAFYADNELSGSIVCKIGQTDAYFATSMPKTREEEYIAGDNVKKNKFALIGALASANQSNEKTFEQAWEEEYLKIFE